MQRLVIACLLLTAAHPSAAAAQRDNVPLHREAPPPRADPFSRLPLIERERRFADRYGDALLGTLAGGGIGLSVAGLLGTGIGAAIGCGDHPFGCFVSVLLGGTLPGALGWIVGVGTGAALGAGNDPLEGLGALGLGFLCAGVVLASFLGGVGAGMNEWPWAFGLGGTLGGVALALTTPLFAALFAEADVRRQERAFHVSFAPAPGGLTLGVAGTL